jgi:hypothetical protein
MKSVLSSALPVEVPSVRVCVGGGCEAGVMRATLYRCAAGKRAESVGGWANSVDMGSARQ